MAFLQLLFRFDIFLRNMTSEQAEAVEGIPLHGGGQGQPVTAGGRRWELYPIQKGFRQNIQRVHMSLYQITRLCNFSTYCKICNHM